MREVGNVLDRWEQLPNDLRFDPGFEALNHALQNLYETVEAAPKEEPPRSISRPNCF
jgi:hypothetical protein